MVKEDEEKTSFITSQGVFCYSKMPFGLRNVGAPYKRLVDKAFYKQTGRNLERRRRDVPRFLAKSAEKSLPFFKVKKCIKKSNFHWTKEVEAAFKQMKQVIAELTTLNAPKKRTHFLPGGSKRSRSGAGLILINLEGTEFHYALRFRFEATNNEAEYEALIAGLRISEEMGVKNLQENVDSRPWLRCVGSLQEKYVLREIHEGSCSMHAGMRSVVAKALRTRYYWHTMHKDARALIRACQDCQVHRPILRNPQQKLNPITSLWSLYSTEAVFPAEIGMPTLRAAEVDMVQNNKALGINLDLLEERREQAAIREAKRKAKIEKYYNSKVRRTSFKPGDLVYSSNDASHTEKVGKIGPKWE
nr:reverse transcriptase domain-containing protein [Tanacetum cinerariifolium]